MRQGGVLGARLAATVGTSEFRHYFFEFGPHGTVGFVEYANVTNESQNQRRRDRSVAIPAQSARNESRRDTALMPVILARPSRVVPLLGHHARPQDAHACQNVAGAALRPLPGTRWAGQRPTPSVSG